MPDEGTNLEFGPLADYTSCLALYHGEGTLTLSNQQTFSCTFEAGQLRKGNVFLLCSISSFEVPFLVLAKQRIERFDGTTAEGFHLSSVGNILAMRTGRDQLTCRLRLLSVEMMRGIQASTVHFGITNFVLDADLSLNLEHAGTITPIRVKPLKEHHTIVQRIKDLRTIDVTCEAVGFLSEATSATALEQAIDHLCYLLSVGRGTKVEWIYQDVYDEMGTRFSRLHGSRITKEYSPHSIFKRDQEIRVFVERTYSTYITNRERYQLAGRTIDTYLDAKVEHDYLQVRGIKMAVSMEVIKDVFINLPDAPIKELASDQKTFDKLTRALSEAISPILEEAHIILTGNKLRGKLKELNRRAFEEVLTDIFKRLQLQIEDEEKQRFIQSRNSLVHRGRFHCETQKQAEPDDRELFREYCFLMSILDRVVLRLLGYHGIYWDCRSPGEPILKELT